MKLAAAAAAVFLALACTRDDAPDMRKNTASQSIDNKVDPRSTTGDNSSTMNPVMPPQQGAPAAAPSGVAVSSQRVELNEYSIRMPQTLAPGQQAFTVANGGKEMHSFAIQGNGVDARLPSDLPRGDTATLELNLKPGTYQVYCPVDGHKGKGMSLMVTVR